MTCEQACQAAAFRCRGMGAADGDQIDPAGGRVELRPEPAEVIERQRQIVGPLDGRQGRFGRVSRDMKHRRR